MKMIEYTMDYGGHTVHVRFPDQSHIKLRVGDLVTIKSGASTVTGTATSASHYPREGWFIELAQTNTPGGVSYWKQYLDGGQITHLHGLKVESR
jgi:hypothetical protein